MGDSSWKESFEENRNQETRKAATKTSRIGREEAREHRGDGRDGKEETKERIASPCFRRRAFTEEEETELALV
eukprot:751038-Hanusia_phi.AAC.3